MATNRTSGPPRTSANVTKPTTRPYTNTPTRRRSDLRSRSQSLLSPICYTTRSPAPAPAQAATPPLLRHCSVVGSFAGVGIRRVILHGVLLGIPGPSRDPSPSRHSGSVAVSVASFRFRRMTFLPRRGINRGIRDPSSLAGSFAGSFAAFRFNRGILRGIPGPSRDPFREPGIPGPPREHSRDSRSLVGSLGITHGIRDPSRPSRLPGGNLRCMYSGVPRGSILGIRDPSWDLSGFGIRRGILRGILRGIRLRRGTIRRIPEPSRDPSRDSESTGGSFAGFQSAGFGIPYEDHWRDSGSVARSFAGFGIRDPSDHSRELGSIKRSFPGFRACRGFVAANSFGQNSCLEL